MIVLALSLALTAAPRTAVMPLMGGDAISDRAAASLTETLAVELQKQGSMEVVLPHLSGTLLSPLKPREEVGCKTDPCMAEVAGALGAERLVTGEVSWDGGKLVLNLRLLEGRSARVLTMSERSYTKGTLNDLLGGLPEMVPELLRAPARKSEPPPAKTEPPSKVEPIKAAAGPTPDKPPPGQFVLHYHHVKSRYNVRLVTWETFQGRTELRQWVPAVVPVDAARREPDGKDDFGVFWMVPASVFRNGRVNFAVLRGATFDECTRPVPGQAGNTLYWILADGPEAWMNVPDCEIFATADEARRNHGK